MLSMLANLLGGLGLLLIGMGLMTDGLKLAAGNNLRDILALWTNSRLRGLCSGFLITGIVQSSSAVTVATIGFANAGMLSLERALWVIYGSNVGTTMTAWIVALIGFKVDIDALAMPLVGIGALLKLSGGKSNRGSLGMALVGFGLLFLGIDGLKSAFDTLESGITLPTAENQTFVLLVMYLGAGFLMTTVMQSSSAAMVVALSAAESGLVPFNGAAAVVIGANLGTTTTAIFTIFGATPTAKRVALGHVCFNLITASVAVVLLPAMLWLGAFIQDTLQLSSSPAVSLAIFHSSFNILGVVLMAPLSGWLVNFLLGRFQTQEETASCPRYLDRNVLSLPYIAVDALTLELSRVATMSVQLLQESLQKSASGINEKVVTIKTLARETGLFTTELNKQELTPFTSEAVQNLMHVTQEYMLTLEISDEIASLSSIFPKYRHGPFSEELQAFIAAVDEHLDSLTPDNTGESINSKKLYKKVEKAYDVLKDAILVNTSFGHMDISDMDVFLQYANQVKRGCRHLRKGARRLNAVRESLRRNPEGDVENSAQSPPSDVTILQETKQALEDDEAESHEEREASL